MTREDGWVPSVAVVVPAGGRASRLDGSKLAADVGGMTLLDRTLSGLPVDALVVCVGPEVPTTRSVRWVADDPPFTGPLTAVAAGVATLPADVRTVVLVGGDMPDAGRAVAALLEAQCAPPAAADSAAGVCAVVVDSTGRLQPLLTAWPIEALRGRLDALAPTEGRALSALLDGVSLRRVVDIWGATLDVDSAADLVAARARLGGQPG